MPHDETQLIAFILGHLDQETSAAIERKRKSDSKTARVLADLEQILSQVA